MFSQVSSIMFNGSFNNSQFTLGVIATAISETMSFAYRNTSIGACIDDTAGKMYGLAKSILSSLFLEGAENTQSADIIKLIKFERLNAKNNAAFSPFKAVLFDALAESRISQNLHDTTNIHENKPIERSIDRPNFFLEKNNRLDLNLLLADEILKELKNEVPITANNMQRNRKLIKHAAKNQDVALDDFTDILVEADSLLKKIRNITHTACEKQNAGYFTRSKINSENTLHARIGNCDELSNVVLFKAMQKGAWNIHVDKAYLKPGDHMVVVVGRKFGSNRQNYKTWGDAAVVVDAWAEKYFKLSDLKTHLEDYVEVDFETGKPVVSLFDPSNQKLKIALGNICSAEDVLKFITDTKLNNNQIQLMKHIVQRLEEFFTADDLQSKVAIANKLYELSINREIRTFKIVNLLQDQINHFIELN